jgi:hypothetical protein
MRPLTPPDARIEVAPTEGVLVRFAPAKAWPLDRWPAPLVKLARRLATVPDRLARLPRSTIIAVSASATLIIARLVSLL